jgi:hypothetical protein
MVAHGYNPRYGEVEMGGSQVEVSSGKVSKILSKKQTKKQKESQVY